MGRFDYNLNFPIEPVQTLGGAGLQRGEESGEVFCPRKLSHIAKMRCHQYQQENGCGAGCAAAVSEQEIDELRVAMIFKDDGGVGAGSYICAECGGAKLALRSNLCMHCAAVSNNLFLVK